MYQVTIAGGDSLPVVVLLAVLLGLRHAADPDHLVAISTLVAFEPEQPVRRAATLGLSWGAGHGAVVLLVGVPAVLVGLRFPGALADGAEVMVGLMMVALAVLLLVRWRRGRFHSHVHTHGEVQHRHLHAHRHQHHRHEHARVRSPIRALSVGLVHGVAGTAALSLLVLASLQSRGEATLALVCFALTTTVAMAALSSGLGYALARGPVRLRLPRFVPALAVFAVGFGVWYTLLPLL